MRMSRRDWTRTSGCRPNWCDGRRKPSPPAFVPPIPRELPSINPDWRPSNKESTSWTAICKRSSPLFRDPEGKEPNARDLARLIQHTTDERIPVLLVEPQFSQRLAEVLARETGVRILVADPLAQDWESNLRQLAERLVEAFGAGGSQP
jgi:hypothetical protein